MGTKRTITLGVLTVLLGAALIFYVAGSARMEPSIVQAAPNAINSYQNLTDSNTGITVTGEGKVSVKPDLAVGTVGVEVTGASLSDATNQSNTKMTSVINKIKSFGIEDKDIQTTNYSIIPISQPSPKANDANPPAITGYRVMNQVRITVRKLADLGKVLDGVVTAGANSIYGVSFGVDDLSVYRQQARAAAVKDAQDKAGQLAKNAGVQLGNVISITEGSVTPGPLLAPAARSFAAGAQDVPIQSGEMDVVVDISVRFGIK